MSAALARMDAAGFTEDVVADGPMLRAAGSNRRFDPIEVAVVETVRFEGMSNPDDEAIHFAIASAADEPIGTFSMPYGPAAGREESAIVDRLHQPPFSEEEVRAHQEHDHITAVFSGREAAEAVEELRALGLGSEHLGVAVQQDPHVAFEHDAHAELIHDTEIGAQAGAVVGILAGLALGHVVGPAKLGVLTLQALQLRQLVSGRSSPAALVSLGLAHPQPHCLGFRSQLLRDRADRFPLRAVLALVVQHHPHGPLPQLIRVLPLPGHRSILLKDWSVHQTRGASPDRIGALVSRSAG